jgi:quercetin dioxygenase-like cupin family protein
MSSRVRRFCAADSDQSATVVVKPVISTAVTASGQTIMLPQKDAHAVVTTYTIAKGAKLPEHKHPFIRYAYVLAGTLRVTNTETGGSDV